MRRVNPWRTAAGLAAAFTCCVLTAAAQAAPAPELGRTTSWAFDPPEDKFTEDALLDLRHLNEKVAGEKGFIALSEDGMGFVDGAGEPIRFWSVVSDLYRKSPQEMETHCRFLAKIGVNMVRMHASISPKGENADLFGVDRKEIDGIWRFVAIARKHGIYSTISPYWPNSWHLKDAGQYWGIEGYETKGSEPWGILFFNERLQQGYKAWVKALYTPTNPYTGIPLKDEPAVAIIQVMNEDSLLFYTFQHIKPPQRKLLRTKFGEWLTGKYGSLDKAKAAWGGTAHKNDDFAAGEAGMYDTWEFTAAYGAHPPAGRAERMADQLEFMGWIQHKFYADIGDYYHNELGCKQLVNAMNWKSGDPVLLDDVERWTYTANEVLAVNRYTGGVHVGQNRGYRIDPGHQFVNMSVLRNPGKVPVALKQAVGHPMLITECAWVHPNLYQSEGPTLAAAYMSMNGVDSLYWFAANQPRWLLDPRRTFWRVGDSYALDKWSGCVPGQMGMFPANALAFRKGYIEAADEPVVYEERSLENMWSRATPIISEGGKFDPNRDAGDYAPESTIKQDVSRLAFLVGPVHVKLGGDERNSRVADLSRYIDDDKGVVRSVTGQIELDHKIGLLTVNTPKYRAVAGFLKDAGGRFELGDVTIRSDNDYATIIVTALDGRPIAESGQVLVQVGTVARLSGWTTVEDTFEANKQPVQGRRIVNTGRPPWRIKNTQATLTIANPAVMKAVLLDINGYAARAVPVSTEGGAVTIELPADTMYLVLSAR